MHLCDLQRGSTRRPGVKSDGAECDAAGPIAIRKTLASKTWLIVVNRRSPHDNALLVIVVQDPRCQQPYIMYMFSVRYTYSASKSFLPNSCIASSYKLFSGRIAGQQRHLRR